MAVPCHFINIVYHSHASHFVATVPPAMYPVVEKGNTLVMRRHQEKDRLRRCHKITKKKNTYLIFELNCYFSIL